jgi:hypothetical protein
MEYIEIVNKMEPIFLKFNIFLFYRDKFPPLPFLRQEGDIVLNNYKNENSNDDRTEYQKLMENTKKVENLFNGTAQPATTQEQPKLNGDVSKNNGEVNGHVDKEAKDSHLGQIPEEEEKSSDALELEENVEASEVNNEIIEEDREEDNSSPFSDLTEEPAADEQEKTDEVIEELMNGEDERISGEDEDIIDSILNENDSENNGTADER